MPFAFLFFPFYLCLRRRHIVRKLVVIVDRIAATTGCFELGQCSTSLASYFWAFQCLPTSLHIYFFPSRPWPLLGRKRSVKKGSV